MAGPPSAMNQSIAGAQPKGVSPSTLQSKHLAKLLLDCQTRLAQTGYWFVASGRSTQSNQPLALVVWFDGKGGKGAAAAIRNPSSVLAAGTEAVPT
jgi:hypothetical protein